MCLGTDTQASAIHSCLVTSGSCAGLDKKKASSPLGLTCAFMSVCAQVNDGAGRNDGCKSCVCYFHLSVHICFCQDGLPDTPPTGRWR